MFTLLCIVSLLLFLCFLFFFFLMIRRPPRSTRTDTLFPYTTLFRSVLSLIPGIICALIIGFNYLNEQSVRRFEQDAEFAMGFTFFACVALLPLLCFIVYRKMKPKMEAAIELFEGLAEKEERTRKVEEDVRYLEELELAKRRSPILGERDRKSTRLNSSQ